MFDWRQVSRLRIPAGPATERRGNLERHGHNLRLAVEETDHGRAKITGLHSNDFVERVQKTVLNGFRRAALCMKICSGNAQFQSAGGRGDRKLSLGGDQLHVPPDLSVIRRHFAGRQCRVVCRPIQVSVPKDCVVQLSAGELRGLDKPSGPLKPPGPLLLFPVARCSGVCAVGARATGIAPSRYGSDNCITGRDQRPSRSRDSSCDLGRMRTRPDPH